MENSGVVVVPMQPPGGRICLAQMWIHDTYKPSVLAGTLIAYTDAAVWGLAYIGIKKKKKQLLSCSAGGTVKLQNLKEKFALLIETRSV